MSRSNNSNKTKKQIFEAKVFKSFSYCSLETGCDLCPQRLIYKSNEKLNKKDEDQKLKFIFENKYFQKSYQI